MQLKKTWWVFLIVGFTGSFCWDRLARSEPILQLYVEGATYNQHTQTWTAYPNLDVDGAVRLRLWIIGNTSVRSPIFDVRVSAAYPSFLRSANGDLEFTWTPTTTGGLGGFYDPSLPPAVSFVQYGPAGTTPTIVGNRTLPTHGIFGPETVWQEFALGTFSLQDSPIADFYGSFPSPGNRLGQINVYEVSVRHTGDSSLLYVPIHFDAYGYVTRKHTGIPRPVFAPFSHDAEIVAVPAPPSLALLASGGMCMLAWGLRGLKRKARASG